MKVQLWRHFDPWMLTIAVVLTIIGIAFINSATLEVESLVELVPRQSIYGILGVVVALLVAGFDYRNLMVAHWWIYGFVLVLFLVIFVSGQLGEAGARRWLLEGAVQPSELAKILIIISLSQYLATQERRIKNLSTILRSLAYMAVPVLLLFLQPDLGMSVLLMAVWFVMVWLAGMRWLHQGLFVAAGLAAVPIVWPLMEIYQKQRIVAFINPSLVPDQEYNIRQALISIGSGGLFGKGLCPGQPEPASLSARAPHRLYLFCHCRGDRHGGRNLCARPHRRPHFSHPARGPALAGPGRHAISVTAWPPSSFSRQSSASA